MFHLKILVTSNRPGRSGPSLARWVVAAAAAYPDFQVSVLDLAEINLPFMDEPNHPVKRDYQHDHTKAWSRLVDEADAFVVVAAEYNHGFTAVFKNAVDYLAHEWKHKPVAFVGYGGIAGGSRSIQMMKPVLSGLGMVPINEAVYLPFFRNQIDSAGTFGPTDEQTRAVQTLLTSLLKWTAALKPLRG